MRGFLHDLKIACRLLVATPWTTLAAVLILALGTGVNTSVFAVAYGILLRPLPYLDPSRIVVVSMMTEQGNEYGMPLGEFEQWRERLRTVERVAAYSDGEFTVRGLGEPRVVRAAIVRGDFFQVLGVPPIRGTVNARENDGWVAVSQHLTMGAGESAATAIGRTATIGQGAYGVAAIMPGTFAFPTEQAMAWLPASSVTGISWGQAADARRFRLVARLKPGVTLEQARQDAQRVLRQIEARTLPPPTPGVRRMHSRANVVPVTETLTGAVRPVLAVLVAAAILVLLVACGNVASLLVGRAIAHSHDLAVRLALGASRWHLVRAVFAESLILAVGASALGAWIGLVLVRLFIRVATGVLPRLDAVAVDLPVVAASAGVALLVAVLCGAVPALNAARSDFAPAFRGTSASASRRVRRMRAAIVAGQIALSIVLLTGAGLVTRTVLRLLDQATGIQPDKVVSMRLVMSDTTSFTVTSRVPFVRELLDRVRAVPGVRAAGIGSCRPPNAAPLMMTVRMVYEGHDQTQMIVLASVTPGYFQTIGARLVRGRLFDQGDYNQPQGAAILSESAARHMYTRDPLGRPLAFALPPDRKRRPQIVGIVGDIKYAGLDSSTVGTIYLMWPDLPASVSYLMVRTAGDPSSVTPSLSRLVRGADPAMPVPEVRRLEDDIASSIADRRLRVLPAAGFALLAFVVALVGLAAVVGRAVTERRRELAIRGALGATPGGNLRMIVGAGARWAGAGVVLGLASAAAVGRTLARLLYGVGPYDPLTFAAVGVVVGLAAILTCYLAARRALREDLLQLLRAE